MNIGIIGATGYGGVELYRILANHRYVENIHLYTSSAEKKSYIDEYPHLSHIKENELKPLEPDQIKEENDVVFLATPSGISASLTPELLDDQLKIIDLSGDLRLKNSDDYEKWYKKAPAPEMLLQKAVYGLTELYREDIKNAKILANPGCYPTATLLGLAPLVREKIVKENSIIVDAKSGVSGAGRNASLATSFVEIQDNFKIYKVHQHQHIPEIEQELHKWDEKVGFISFSTHLVPMTRGIMATMYIELLEEWNTSKLVDLYESFYKHSPFVRVRTNGTFPSTKEVYGSNYCDIGLAFDQRTSRLTVVSVIDNLMKGAAGQAVQNFNIMSGFQENEGLNFLPVYP
ncbi:N-acetyl-gamma-glutamyl-phosphate reductase [Aeribacillus composti]|uniref:N-acetyl-gamma-glutamyl-phosphate reductase n=1 Tax=Aeribacillus composti TaxID=1868734 RepID=UPI002E2408D3|nr:N-acetyl-gamma-glutamyl-phosphate reductase [Aeribacillus composti]